MEEEQLDSVLVPLGLLVFGAYHVWLIFTLKRSPRRTVIGLNAESRHQWMFSMMAHLPSYMVSKWAVDIVFASMMSIETREKLSGRDGQDPVKNGVLAVQTIRNNIMASTLLATTAITLSSIISVFVSNKSNSATSKLLYGNKSAMLTSIKYFAILICFLVAFLCNVQCIRYYAHVSFLSTMPTSQGRQEAMEYAARSLNRGSLFWSLGLRAFYLSFPLFLWIFGPIPMIICCVMMSFVLYFLDTTTSFTRHLHIESCKFKFSHDTEFAVAG